MRKPNVLWITVDQMRIHEMGCYTKDDRLKALNTTPNIDALARNSVQFENAFSPNPVCTPARSCMISGKYGRSCIGTVGNAADPTRERTLFPTPTIAECFRDNGYDTAIVGKWHIHNMPQTLGFDDTVYQDVHHLNKNQAYWNHGVREISSGNAYDYELQITDDYLSQYAQQGMEKQNKPFFLFHNISLPHMPYFDVDDEYKLKYIEAQPPLRKNVKLGDDADFIERWFKIYWFDSLYYNHHGEQYQTLPDGFDMEKLYAMYCGLISAADAQVGRLMAMLRRYGLIDNTIVVFCSDHGDNMGSHGLFNKDVSFEESIHIPLLVSCPGIPAGLCTDCVSLIDIAPTLLELCGLPLPDCFDGISLTPAMHGKGLDRDRVFFECTNGEIGCRTKEFLFSSQIELHDFVGKDAAVVHAAYRFFDMKKDPFQLHNLANEDLSQEMSEMRESLLISVQKWNETTPWVTPKTIVQE